MSIEAYKSFSTKKTSQDKPIPGRESEMAENYAGGYAFEIDKWDMLDRFLVLGTSGGTYYVGERELTEENAKVVLECLGEDPSRVIDRAIEISESGRAASNDPALFVLAMASAQLGVFVRAHDLERVARTGTHLFHFLEFVKQFRGWGRSLRGAVSGWYNRKSPEDLAYQVVKYRQRDGWTHMDALRLAHPVPATPAHDAIYAWVCDDGTEEKRERWEDKYGALPGSEMERLNRITAFETAIKADDEDRIVRLIQDHNLTREMIPTNMRGKKVWEALLESMPMWAMVRNLGNMGKADLLVPGNFDTVSTVTDRLRDQEYILRSRLHPISILIALKTYASGSGYRSSSSWPVVPQVVDALNDAFYLSFGNVKPMVQEERRIMLALDVSGSMGAQLGKYPITCAEGVGALALVTANVEDKYIITAFSAEGDAALKLSDEGGEWSYVKRDMSQISLSPRERLDDVVKKMRDMNFGRTDCALPMLYAMEKGIEVDAFVVYCVDEKTEILTSSGWKQYNEVSVEDEVYTMNHDTGLAEWQHPIAINVFPEEKRELVSIESRGHSSLSTKDHRWPVRRKGNSEWFREWKTTRELTTKDYIQCVGQDSTLPTEPQYEDAFVELVAWVYTEGCWNASRAISIVQSVEVHPALCDRIRLALTDIYGEPSESMYEYRFDNVPLWVEDEVRESGCITWRLNQAASASLTAIISEKDKSVSLDWLRNLTLDQLNIFIDASMLADGHKSRMRFSQTSSARAESFALACMLAGRPVSYCHIKNDHHNCYEIGVLHRTQTNPVSHARNSDGRSAKIETVHHRGIVWCPTTPNGTWLARRDGTVYWTGNTDNETWTGDIHPTQALQMYRDKHVRHAKLVVVGMTSTGFSIADPQDPNSLDVVGFDTATPNLVSEFVRGV